MVMANTPSARWTQFDGERRGFITRLETYASYTIAKLMTPTGYTQENTELTHDYQAVGAQAVNHLANKIMLALFAPSRPFFRLDPDMELAAELEAAGVSMPDLAETLSKGEKEAIKALDRMALRPKLYEAVKQLIVLGNTLMYLAKDDMRVVNIKNYAVRRSMSGKVLELMVIDKVKFDELEDDVQEQCRRYTVFNREDQDVILYRWIKRSATGQYHMTQWVDHIRLPSKFDGSWPEDQMPYRVLTWDLSDGAHYGTGLVEDYKGDFSALSTLSVSKLQAAILSSEFRWLVNPAGMTKVEDFEQSANGAAIAGVKGDIELVQSGKAADLQVTINVEADYVTRIGRGFLLGTSVTRDAERVTAEEIRMQANELETSLGGAYSRLAVDFQIPMAYWLLEIVKLGIRGHRIQPSIVTGLEALSRTGDLEDLRMWLADLAALAALPDELKAILKMDKLAAALAAPRRITTSDYMKSPKEQQAEADAQAQRQLSMDASQQGIATAGKIAEQQGNPA